MGAAAAERQIAYDRLLERLYAVDEGWVVKGATALLARDLGVRGTLDIDVFRKAAIRTVEAELREAAALDLGDWFEFEVGAAEAVDDAANGLRLPIKSTIGGTVWVAFHVDLLGEELVMTGVAERMPALARVAMPGVEQHGYRVYPMVDHVADKVVATFDRYGPSRAASTRYKDLVDLVVIVRGASIEAESQKRALASEAERRGVRLPGRFEVPDRELWERGYAAEAGRSLLDVALTLDEALEVVQPFVDPLLDGSAEGTWDPTGTWE